MDEAGGDEQAQAGEGPRQLEVGKQACNIKCTIVLQRIAGGEKFALVRQESSPEAARRAPWRRVNR